MLPKRHLPIRVVLPILRRRVLENRRNQPRNVVPLQRRNHQRHARRARVRRAYLPRLLLVVLARDLELRADGRREHFEELVDADDDDGVDEEGAGGAVRLARVRVEREDDVQEVGGGAVRVGEEVEGAAVDVVEEGAEDLGEGYKRKAVKASHKSGGIYAPQKRRMGGTGMGGTYLLPFLELAVDLDDVLLIAAD